MLEYRCSKCGKYYELPFKAEDRGQLKMRGVFKSDCPYCDFKQKLIINDVRAVKSVITTYSYALAFVFNLICGLIVFFFKRELFINPSSSFAYYALTLLFFIPFLVASAHIENQMKMIKTFNSYYV